MFAISFNESHPSNLTNNDSSNTFLTNESNFTPDPGQSQLVQDFNNSSLFCLEQDKFVPLIKGVLCPFWAFVTLVTNTMVCVVLTSKRMISPTNVLLIAIACSDMLTGFLPVPCMLYFYASERYKDWVPYSWCFAYQCLTDLLPTIFHTSTIWLTVTLAAQRYIYVCRPVRAKLFCTIPNFIKVIAAVFVCSFLFHSCRFFENDYTAVNAVSRLSYASQSSSSPSLDHIDHILPTPTSSQYPIVPVTTDAINNNNNNNSEHQPNRNKVIVVACRKYLKGFINAHKQTYFNVYYWSRVVFIHILPCVSLVLLNAALIGALRKASARRRRLLHYGDNKKHSTTEANHREELVCVLEPKKSLPCSIKNEDKTLARDDKSFAAKNFGEPQIDTQGMLSQEKNIKDHPLAEANDQSSRYHVISIALNDQNPATNVVTVPNSGPQNSINIANDGNYDAKPDNKNPHRQQGCQESRIRSNSGVRTFSVGSVALKEAKRFKTKHKASVSMVAKKNKQRRQAECNCTTLMLVVVVGLFLLVEVPLAALFVLQIIDNTFELNIINYSSGQIVTWVINMLILVGYSVNFVVYCAMNREFRSTFRERILSYIFFCGQDSFPVSCGVKDESSSSKIHEVERIALPTRTISGFFHYGKPHSRRHRSFFHMSPKNRSYIKDKMASSISPAT